MPEVDPNSYARQLEARIVALEELLAALERTVVEQSEHLERSSEAQSHLAAIVQSADAAIMSISLDFRIQSWNAAAERLFGYCAQETIGRRPDEVFTFAAGRERAPIDFFKSVEAFRQPATQPRYFEETLQRKDGTTCRASFIASGIYDANAQLTGVSTIVRDISEHRRKERDLARLAAIVESSDDAITGISTDFRITSWNRSAERLFGLSAREAIGQPLELTQPPQLRELVRRNMVEDLAAARERHDFVRRLEIPIPKKDGTVAEVSLVVSGIFDAAGNVVGMSQIFRDITQRKRAEREQALLAAIVASTDDAVVSLSSDGRITSWNRGAEALLGFSPSEAIGQPITLYVPPHLHALAEEGVRGQLAAAGERKTVERRETQVQRKDKTLLEVSVVSCGIYDSTGTLIGLSGIIRDVTESKHAERELTRLSSIVNASNDAIIGFSRELKITSWNPGAEAIYGFTAKEAIGCGFELFVPAEELPAAIEADQRLFQTGQPVSFEQRAQKKDGTWFVSVVNVFPIRDADGNVMAGAGIGRDVTES
ncbi:MAG TPA: PAS domain S-box protein, partial [Candidatus Binataceae bacterium]